MAWFDMTFPEDLLDGLLNTEAEDIMIAAIENAAPILEESMKRSARSAIMHEGESEMVESIKASKTRRTKDGSAIICTVGPTGTSKHTYNRVGKAKSKQTEKVSNALKAIWKEYGIAGKQAPSPFITNATENAEAGVIDAMQKTVRQKVGEK